jgi:hypothetical protein
MSESYAVRICNTQRIPHGVTSDPWYIELESFMDDWKKLVCDSKRKRI